MSSNSKFGIPTEKWSESRNEARDAIISRARKSKTIYYSELVEEIKSIKFKSHDVRLYELLKEISVKEHERERGMLTVLVVNRSKNQPGAGFFELARELGRDTQDTEACFAAEMCHVHTYWKNDAS